VKYILPGNLTSSLMTSSFELNSPILEYTVNVNGEWQWMYGLKILNSSNFNHTHPNSNHLVLMGEREPAMTIGSIQTMFSSTLPCVPCPNGSSN
jgi:hypothetical protein